MAKAAPPLCFSCGKAVPDPTRPVPALCVACFAIPQQCQICRVTTHLSACRPCGHLACWSCLQNELARTCFFCRGPVLEARDATGAQALPHRQDAAQLGRAASRALGYEQDIGAALLFSSDSDEDLGEEPLPVAVQVALTAWLRGELSQRMVEKEAEENVRIAEVSVQLAAVEAHLKALTDKLHELVSRRMGRNPMLKLRELARLYDKITTALLGAAEVFLNRWSRFRQIFWVPFETLRTAWTTPETQEAVARQTVRVGRAPGSISPLLTRALEGSLGQAEEDAARLLDALMKLCTATHELLSLAHVLRGDCTPEQLGDYPQPVRFFERMHTSFTNACAPWITTPDYDDDPHDVMSLFYMFSGVHAHLLPWKWQKYLERKSLAFLTLEMAREADARARHVHQRRRACFDELSMSRVKKRRRERASAFSCTVPPSRRRLRR